MEIEIFRQDKSLIFSYLHVGKNIRFFIFFFKSSPKSQIHYSRSGGRIGRIFHNIFFPHSLLFRRVWCLVADVVSDDLVLHGWSLQVHYMVETAMTKILIIYLSSCLMCLAFSKSSHPAMPKFGNVPDGSSFYTSVDILVMKIY